MQFYVISLLLLGIVISAKADILFDLRQEIYDLNATCAPDGSCQEPRKDDDLFACQCSAACVRHGTCCFDSQFVTVRAPKIRSACRSAEGTYKSYFMVDRCPTGEEQDSVWASMCREEWDGEDDALKLVPVTSLLTLVTYKNYFCFRCHETTDDFLYWNINIGNKNHITKKTIDSSEVRLFYSRNNRTWMAELGVGGGEQIPVALTVKVPTEIFLLAESCVPGLISHCSDTWKDRNTRDKCEAYMGIREVWKNRMSLLYKNVHCALCNYEELGEIFCRQSVHDMFALGVPFSFTHLLDINRSDGELVGKIQKCEESFLWDPYARKCRKLTCALPGFKVKNGKCTPP